MPSKSPNEYKAEDLKDYATANASDTPLPYIAARINTTLAGYNSIFVLGDGRNTERNTNGRKKRAIDDNHYNGPLKSGKYYSVFQRFLDDNVSIII